MANLRNFVFNIGDENRIVVEKINKYVLENSIFTDSYHFTIKALNSYFDSMPDDKNKRRDEDKLWRNNIFAFIGDRGSGKTSCMQSIAQMLANPEKEIRDEQNTVFKESFHLIDMIDPSFVDNDSNVVGMILASLFKEYQNYSKKNDKIKESLRIELANQFAKVQHDFYRMMEMEKKVEDDLEALSSLSAAIDLKQSMLQLIDLFMDFIDNKDYILLIPIDDIDLHSKAATDMVEQIRKYLTLPNVLVLMAVKISQLSKLKRLQFSKEYQDDRNTLTDTELDEMVEKYITKLVPYNHRVYMPDSTFYWNAQLTITKGKEEQCKEVAIRQFIPELIFQKTRYLFYNTSIKTSYIVPNNLRELRQLMRLLYDMPDCKPDGNINTDVEDNRKVFKKYLFLSWMMNHLSATSQQLVNELLAVTDSIQMNAFALRIIRRKFYNKNNDGKLEAPWVGEEKDEICQELDYIMRKDNMVYNVAIGDVLAVIDYIERLDITAEQMYFLFMIKTIYSIRLYDSYVVFCDNMLHTAEKSDKDGSLVFKHNLFDRMQLPDYFKLIGGRVFNTRVSLILPKPSGKGAVSRSNRVINLKQLNDLMKKCIDNPDTVTATEIRMAEFFMLCTARLYRSRNRTPGNNDYYEPGFRTNRDLVYASSFNGRTFAFFDIASFMYNIMDIEQCYSRFAYGSDFWKKIEEKDGHFSESLTHELLEKTREKYSRSNDDDLQGREKFSWFCLRNVEILMDLTHSLDECDYKQSGEDVLVLSDFFTHLSNYTIDSYEKTFQDSGYEKIDYKFAAIIADLLKTISEQIDLKENFEKIYNGYLAYGTQDGEDVSEEQNFDQALAVYLNNPLTVDDQKKDIEKNKGFITFITIRKRMLKKYAIFVYPNVGKILNESIKEATGKKLDKDNVDVFVSTLNEKMAALKQTQDGNSETNHQDALPTPEEPDGNR